MKIIDIERDEWTAFGWAFCYFFFLLCAYYVLRPVRDEMGIQSGIKNLPWLWTGTFVGMLLITPLFGWISSRWPRRIFLPLVYFFFIANLIAFYFAFNTDIVPKTIVAPAFYVWISVFNYFVVSVFWSFMTDVFSTERAKRLFGGIAAGGSIGAMTGPTITAALVKTVGVAQLMLISAALLGFAVLCIYGLSHWARTRTDMSDAERLIAQQKEQALGGGMLDGIKLIFKSRYLLIICAYIILGQALGTYFYLEQLRVVAETISSSADRTQLFAKLDLAVNSIALFIQLFITSALLKRLGLVFCLTALPAVGVLSLGWTALMPTLLTIAICTVVRRAMEFAISKPAREILYTVVTREERYKSKNVMDTIVSRGGDLMATWTHAGIRAFGHATASMALLAIPFAVLMVATGAYLGRAQRSKEDLGATIVDNKP